MKYLRVFYNSICFLGASFWVVRYVVDYIDNNDISSISFESFDLAKKHRAYPTFTICFSDADTRINALKLNDLYSKYHPSKISIDFYSKDVNGKEFNTWTTPEFLSYAGQSIKQRNPNISSFVGQGKFPFFLSYMDYQKLCFTKETALNPSSNTMKYDEIVLNMNKFEVNNLEGIPNESNGCRNQELKAPDTKKLPKTNSDTDIRRGDTKNKSILSRNRNSPNNDPTKNSDDYNRMTAMPTIPSLIKPHHTNSNHHADESKGYEGFGKASGSHNTSNIADNGVKLERNIDRDEQSGFVNEKRKPPMNRVRRNIPPYGRLPSTLSNDINIDNEVESITMRLYLHDPGYLLTNINHEQAEYQIKNIKFEEENKLISTRIQQVTRLRKRPDANEECDPSIENDDKNYLSFITSQLNCTPWYWKSILPNENNLENCTYAKLVKIHDLVNDRKNIPFYYKPSCTNTKIVAVTDSENAKMGLCGEDFWAVRVYYPSEMFTQITNTREVDSESLWSGIGGFFGMFLGFSLMQLPDLISLKYFCPCYKSK